MLNLSRQQTIFTTLPQYRNIKIDVVGVGATGSYLVWFLSKIGFENIHVWDDDKIMEENIPNQCFFTQHEHQHKVDAVYQMVKQGSGIEVVRHKEKVMGGEQLGPIIFLLTDTMSSRKEIWKKSIKFNLNVDLMIETRMGANNGRIYTINPIKESHISGWENTLYDDDQAQESLCGTSSSIAPTAGMVANMAVWQLINWCNSEKIDNEIIFSTEPWMIMKNQYGI